MMRQFNDVSDMDKFIKEHMDYPLYGIWHVTYNDYTGTRDYGIWEGLIDEIAFSIDQRGELTFTPIEIKKPNKNLHIDPNEQRAIQIPITPYYQLYLKDKIAIVERKFNKFFEFMHKTCPYEFFDNKGFVTLRYKGTEEEEKEYKRQEALKKLTDEEKKILGLI